MEIKKLSMFRNFKICLTAAVFAVGFFTFSANCAHAAPVYYSVGQSASNLMTGTPTVTITSGAAVFSAAQSGNIGVGDRVTYNTSSVAYIAAKTNSDMMHWTLVTATGGVPANVSGATVNSITREYTSLAVAEAGASDANHLNTSDLATNNYQLNFPCYYDTGADTTAVTVDGYTTNATNYIKIYTPSNTSTEANNSQRHQGKWDDAKYSLVAGGSATYSGVVDIGTIYHLRIEGLQIRDTTTVFGSGESHAAISYYNLPDGSSDIRIDNNILRSDNGGSSNLGYNGGVSGWSAVSSLSVYNNVIYGFEVGIRATSQNNTNHKIYNNTILTTFGNYGIQSGGWPTSATLRIKNNLVQGDGTNYSVEGSGFTYEYNNNISQDDTSLNSGSTDCGGHSCRNQTVAFADSTNKDYHLTINDTAARNSGVDLSADANLPVTTDIDGHSRPTGTNVVDIGADEGATAAYYSVGQNTNDHSIGNGGATCSTTGACTVTIASGTATFNYAQTATNLGVGDKVTYNTTSVAYISQKVSTTQWKLITATGATPADVTGQTVNSITHAFLSLNGAIGNGSNGAGDSSHLNTSDLKTNNYQLNIPCYYDTGANASSLTMATGYVTSLPNYIKIYAPNNTSTEVNVTQRHQGKWDDNKFRVDYNASFSLNIAYTIVDGLQFDIGGGGVVMYSGAERTIVSNSIIKSSYGANYGIQVERRYSKEAFAYNNIIYGVANGIARYYDGSGGTLYAYNNTVYGCTTAGIRDMAGSSVVAKNNIVQSSTDGYAGTFASGGDNNISDLASDAPGTNPHNSATVSFVDATNYDFHLSSSDTAAKGAGVNLQNDSYLHFSQDIDGQERTGTWDIGADEFDAGTVGSPDIGADAVEDGLVGYWSFNGDDVSGATAYDRSGNNNSGTINGATVVEGKLGQGMSFNGTSDYINIGDKDNLEGFSQMTLSVWINRRAIASNENFIIGKENRYKIDFGNGSSGVVRFLTGNDWGGSILASASTVSLNQWVHIVATYDGSVKKLYFNGVQDANTVNTTGNIGSNTNIVTIAQSGTSTGPSSTANYFNGIIDEARIYNRALSADEVGNLYRSGQAKIVASQNGKNTSGLVGLWSFDGPDVSGTTAYDRSGNGYNGTIYNTPSVGPGKIGQALDLNGNSQYIYSSIFDLGTTNTVTMSAWVKSNSATGGGVSHGVLYKCSTVFELRLQSNGALNTFLTNDVAWHSAASSPVYTDWDQWHHLVAVYNGSNVIIYRDGVQVGISGVETGNLPSSSQYLSMGRGSTATSYWDGKMDDVRIYNRALTADEVGDLYRMGQVKIRK